MSMWVGHVLAECTNQSRHALVPSKRDLEDKYKTTYKYSKITLAVPYMNVVLYPLLLLVLT